MELQANVDKGQMTFPHLVNVPRQSVWAGHCCTRLVSQTEDSNIEYGMLAYSVLTEMG